MRRTLSVAIVLGLAGAALLLAPQRIVAQRAARFERETLNGRDVVAREVLVKFRQQPQAADLAQIRADGDADDVRSIGRAGRVSSSLEVQERRGTSRDSSSPARCRVRRTQFHRQDDRGAQRSPIYVSCGRSRTSARSSKG